MSEQEKENKDNKVMVGALMLLAGGILGASVALLYAPQSGEKTRRGITRGAKKARRRTEQAVDDFSQNLSEVVEMVGERASEILEKGRDMGYKAKKELLKAMEEGEARLQKERARLSKML
ncbi:YtxH domain-containing protein [Geomonas sp. RF6]|uniref:YtxH domain-containing protein n=1 Tax=Geomonas sp. RF6 TaxID=2897342 RepID=UPI001E3F1087|nr:YtxH domain-containing protein [Geomonas sp. RF6]UFS71229.1 YtxH domain-containing protein [Geomonas sp. RF6]